MRWIVAVILVFLLQALCLGQSNESLAKDLDCHSDFTKIPFPASRIKLEDYLSPLQGRYTTRYEGLQGVLVSRGSNQFRKYERQYLRDRWSASNLNVCDWERWLTKYEDQCCDFQFGRWWDRSFFDSFLPEKGGIIYQTVVIGQEESLVSWSDFHLMNTGKFRIAKWGFDVARTQPVASPNVIVDPATIIRQRDPPVAIRAMLPKGMLESNNIKITTVQNLVLRPSLKPEKVLARVDVGVDVKFYTNHTKNPWAQLSIKGRADPFGNQYGVIVNFELFCL